MHLWDGLILTAYLILSVGLALRYRHRAGLNTQEFFLSGRHLPWYLAGTSMVATTFAADTPLAVTELVVQNGIAGNWLWWNMAFGAVLTVFFFAHLWRRAGVLTDVELVELRYGGRPAAWLRGIKAVYFGLFMNAIIIGWVCLAMETVLGVLFPDLTFFGYRELELLGARWSAALLWVGLLTVLVALYAMLGGLWGVAVTDAFQFLLAMAGTIALAVFALDEPAVGGIAGLKDRLPESAFRFLPVLGSEAGSATQVLALSITAFLAYIGVQWWASWYPGAEPGGGGYIAQRMMSARSERDAVLSALWFTLAHYCLRPWPWILAALATVALYPGLEQARAGYVYLIRDVLPTGWRGLLVAAFLAAFMSTISSQLNWGTSYLVHDLWRRFLRPGRSERYYVRVARLMTVLLALVALLVSAHLDSIRGAWELVLGSSAGLGLVLIARWYWWRVNAWGELTATLFPLGLAVLGALGLSPLRAPFPESLFWTVGLTGLIWLGVTWLTPPESASTLEAFYRRVRPGGPGWKPLARRCPDVHPDRDLARRALGWCAGVGLVYAALFGTGQLLLGDYLQAGIMLLLGLGCGWLLHRILGTLSPPSPTRQEA